MSIVRRMIWAEDRLTLYVMSGLRGFDDIRAALEKLIRECVDHIAAVGESRGAIPA